MMIAWLQVSNGSVDIAAVLKTTNGSFITAGWVSTQDGCWSMLKGGFVVDVSGPAHLYFEVFLSLFLSVFLFPSN